MIKRANVKLIKDKKKSIIIFLLFIVTLFRIIMISNLPFGVQRTQIYDQGLMLDMSINLINGKWLGNYSYLTLIKGIVYPLFMMLCHFSKIPFYVFFTLIYIFSVVLVILALNKHLKFSSKVVIYLVLLFNPATYAGQTFMEVYRNGLGMSFVLLFISGMIFIYNTRSSNYKFIIASFFLGFVIALISNTREDGIWVLPAVVIFLVVMFVLMKGFRIRYLSMVILLILPLLQMNSIIKYENLKHYNVSYVNEMKDSYYPKAFLDILQIDVGKRLKYNDFTYIALTKSLKNSETLSSVNDLSKVLFSGGSIAHLNAYAMWSTRANIYKDKNFKDGKEADDFFKQVYYELEDAYLDGKFKRDERAISIFMNYLDNDDIIPIIKKTFYSAYYSVTYKDMRFYYIRMDDKDNVSKLFNTYANSEINSDKYDTNFKIFNFFLKVYKLIFPLLTIVSLIIYIKLFYKFLFKKDRNIIFYIATLTLISYFTLLFGMSYTDVISFETIKPYYLAPVYSLQVLFTMILVLSKFEGAKLWKR